MAVEKSVFIQIRATPKEKEAIKKMAEDAGTSVTELILQSSKRVRPWSPRDKKLEKEKIRELARIGTNLNQIARWCNTYKSGAETLQVLVHLRAIEEELKRCSSLTKGEE